MVDRLLNLLKSNALDWAHRELLPELQVQSVSIIGGLMMLCFLAQMLTGNSKWGKRAIWVLGIGVVAMTLLLG